MVKDYESPQDYRDPAKFWTDIGSIYKSKVNEEADTYQRQLTVLSKYLKIIFNNEDYEIKRVLEIGSGYGRITKMVMQQFGARIQNYHCIDISQPMIDSLKDHLNLEIKYYGNDFQIKNFDISDKNTVLDFLHSLPNQQEYKYDLIISVECLMHIRPESIRQAIKNISSLLANKGHLLTLDFYNPHGVGYALSPENFLHDYPILFIDVGGLSMVSLYKLFGQDQSVIHCRNYPIPIH
jgi:SAM-dependent methyltransferase